MGRTREGFRKHPRIAFFALAYLLSWYAWIFRLATGRPSTGPNPLGPFVAAVIVAGVIKGKIGMISILKRLLLWRVPPVWYAVAFLLPVLVNGISILLNVSVFSASRPEVNLGASWKNLVEQFIFIFLFIGLGEEPGWRGFALPHLQSAHSPFEASLILAFFWAIWHLPLFGLEFKTQQIPPFLISIVPAAIILTWISNHTRGSILLPMIFHATVNTIGAGYFFTMFHGVDLNRLWWIYSLVWVVAAVIIVFAPASGMFKKGLTAQQLQVG